MYINFNQDLDKNSLISIKTEAVKHLHAVILLTGEQRQYVMVSPTSNLIVENRGLF